MYNEVSEMDEDDSLDEYGKKKSQGELDVYVIQQNQESNANPAQINDQYSSSSSSQSGSQSQGVEYNSDWGGSWLNAFVKNVITWAQKISGGGDEGSSDDD